MDENGFEPGETWSNAVKLRGMCSGVPGHHDGAYRDYYLAVDVRLRFGCTTADFHRSSRHISEVCALPSVLAFRKGRHSGNTRQSRS
jgi:hypothetical protein